METIIKQGAIMLEAQTADVGTQQTILDAVLSGFPPLPQGMVHFAWKHLVECLWRDQGHYLTARDVSPVQNIVLVNL